MLFSACIRRLNRASHCFCGFTQRARPIFKIKNLCAFNRFYETVGERSHVKGDQTPDLIEKTYRQLLTEQVNRYAYKTAITSINEKEYNYGQLQAVCNAYGVGLVGDAITRDCRVPKGSIAHVVPLILLNNVGQMAAPSVNTIFGCIPPTLPPAELEQAIIRAQPRWLSIAPIVGQVDVLDDFYTALPDFSYMRADVASDVRLPYLRHILHTGKQHYSGMFPLQSVLVWHPERNPFNKFDRIAHPRRTAAFVFTRDLSKIIPLNEYHVINTALVVGRQLHINDEDIIMNTVPAYYSAGQAFGVGLMLAFHARTVMVADHFKPKEVLTALDHHCCTAIVAFAHEFETLLNHKDANLKEAAFRTVKKGLVLIWPGAPLPQNLPDFISRVKKEMNLEHLVVVVGLQETGGAVFYWPFDASENPQTALKLLPHLEAKIVDAHGNVVPYGTPGKLLLKGFNVTPGYRDSYEELTRDIIDQNTVNFFETGIKASVDQQGRFTALELPAQYWTIKTVPDRPAPPRPPLKSI
jgi:acyl-CoA synthetase (AMP-forming)/AMP-acid ligase II